jgi:hypothetical protein
MNEKRDRIDEFIATVWIPAFANTVLNKPAIKDAWDKVARSRDKQERFEFIVGLGPRLQHRINEKRLQLIEPVDQMEQLLAAHLSRHYDQMLAANATLTAYLDSVVSVKERQHRILKFMKVDGKLAAYMGKADEIVARIVSGKDAFEKNREKIQAIVDKVREALGGM